MVGNVLYAAAGIDTYLQSSDSLVDHQHSALVEAKMMGSIFYGSARLPVTNMSLQYFSSGDLVRVPISAAALHVFAASLTHGTLTLYRYH